MKKYFLNYSNNFQKLYFFYFRKANFTKNGLNNKNNNILTEGSGVI